MKNLILTICLLVSGLLLAQDRIHLKSGKILVGKIKYMDDTLVIINAPYKEGNIDYNLKRLSIDFLTMGRELEIAENKGKKIKITLFSNKIIQGKLIDETDLEYVIVDLKKEFQIDTLHLAKTKVKQMSVVDPKSIYFDMGILRGGGSLVGIDVEFVLTERSTIYLGAGFRGFGGGINLFFKPGHKGFGLKLGLNNQGFGSHYVGRSAGPTLFYKARNGISVDLGIVGVLEQSSKGLYGNNDYILWYGIGYRF